MEQHPVPQNVTTFQFRLIGDMTLKQFGYLCAGGILAFISFKLPLPFFFTWPATISFALLGIGFAFVPIEERPMDVWVFSFFKSIYSPTQYIWTHEAPKITKVATPPINKTAPATKTGAYSVLPGIFGQATQPAHQQPTTPQPHSQNIATHNHDSILDQITQWFTPKKISAPPQPTPPASVPIVTGSHAIMPPATIIPPATAQTTQTNTSHMQQEVSRLENTVTQLQSQLSVKTMTDDRIVELQKQLTEVLSERSKMEDELIKLKRIMANPQAPAEASQPTVNIINTQAAAIKVGLPRLTNSPNVITGIIKDNLNNFLPAILVTVTNKENIPMRALKTNKLGQFAASTPLPNDVYLIEAEDPRSRFTFDRIQITLNGGVVPAIELVAKSEKQLVREQLTQEIFGKNQQI